MVKHLAPGTVLLIGALSLSVGWLAGSTSASNQAEADAAARARSGPRPVGSPEGAAPFTRQLRERLDTQPARVPATGRNPFVFEARRAPAAVRPAGDAVVVPPPPAADPLPFTPPAPRVRLSGIAASLEGGATVLTAIVSDNGVLAFVKAGDRLPSGVTVTKVDDTGIVIVDAAGITQTIKLP
jgi:hypothetical protein